MNDAGSFDESNPDIVGSSNNEEPPVDAASQTKVKPLCKDVNRYQKIMKIGEGMYGEVFKAEHRKTKQVVALKKIRMENETEGFPITAIREIQLLQMLDFENIVNLREVCCSKPSTANGDQVDCYLVLDFAHHDLAGLLSNPQIKMELSDIKSILKQLFTALYYLHDNNVLHRDIKAANILFTENGTLKLADFGLARIFSPPVGTERKCYTPNIVTLWYRPPELLLGERRYGPAIDIWGAGCIMTELWLHYPLFRGASEQQQINTIISYCGSICPDVWPDVTSLPLYGRVSIPQNVPCRIKEKLQEQISDTHALNLITKLLTLDPSKRFSAGDALLDHFFFEDPMPGDISKLFKTISGNHFHFTTPRCNRQNANTIDSWLCTLVSSALTDNPDENPPAP